MELEKLSWIITLEHECENNRGNMETSENKRTTKQ